MKKIRRFATAVALFSLMSAALFAQADPGKKGDAAAKSHTDLKLLERAAELLAAAQVSESSVKKDDEESLMRWKIARDAEGELGEILAENPEVRAHLREKLWAIAAPESPADLRRAALGFLALDDDKKSSARLEGIVAVEKDVLKFDAWLLLGDRGSKTAEKRLRERMSDEKAGDDRLKAAVFFGLRGDPKAKPVLEEAVSIDEFLEENGDWCVAAAAALKKLGRNDAWERLCARTKTRIEGLDERLQLENAIWLILRLDYFIRPTPPKSAQNPIPTLGRLPRSIARHIETERPRIKDLEAAVVILKGLQNSK